MQPAVLPFEDRADFERLAVRIESRLIEGVLEAEAHLERKALGLGKTEPRANVPPGELRADARHVRRRLDVEPGLEILGEAVGDFRGDVELMIVRKHPTRGRLGATRAEVGVELEHRVSRFDHVVWIDLNLEQILGGRWRGNRQRARGDERVQESGRCAHNVLIRLGWAGCLRRFDQARARLFGAIRSTFRSAAPRAPDFFFDALIESRLLRSASIRLTTLGGASTSGVTISRPSIFASMISRSPT